MSEQLSLQMSSVDALIEARCAEAHAEIRRMAEEAREFINRSCGQRLRYTQERFYWLEFGNQPWRKR